jgi:hypothetical protein
MIAQVLYGSCPTGGISNGLLMVHSYFQPLNNSRDQHIHSELLEDDIIDGFHTLAVHPIHNQFWQKPLCNVHDLCLPDELHQLLVGFVKDLLH